MNLLSFKYKKPVYYFILVVALTALVGISIGVFSKKSLDTFTETGDGLDANKTLIIDSGHGGLDGGAVSPNGVCEQDITLAIGEKSALICEFLGINYVRTRDDQSSLDFNPNVSIRENKINDVKARVRLVNGIDNGLLVSIHLNSFTDPKYKGAQVFYGDENILSFAHMLQDSLNVNLKADRVAQTVPNSVYLIKNADCPAIVYECGFLTNAEEETWLVKDEYQTKLAICLISTYASYLSEGE